MAINGRILIINKEKKKEKKTKQQENLPIGNLAGLKHTTTARTKTNIVMQHHN